MRNLWKFQSIYELQFFNCPACDYKDKSKQDFVDHACNLHPESVTNFKSISDIDDVVCTWNEIEKKEENITEIVSKDVVNFDKNDVKENAVIVITSELKKEECTQCGLKFPHETVLQKHISLVHKGIRSKQSNNKLPVNSYVMKMDKNAVKDNIAIVQSDDERSMENPEESDVEILDNDINDDVNNHIKSGNMLTKTSKIDYQKRYQPKVKVVSETVSQQPHLKSIEYLKKITASSNMDGGNEQEFKCQVCSMSFNTERHLKIHTRFFHEKTENKEYCDFCDIQFKTMQKAMTHFEEIHLGSKINRLQKREDCKICGKNIRKVSMKIHIKLNHEYNEDLHSHKCELCGKMFKNKASYTQHKQIIHEGKRYKCDICDYTSKQSDSLKRHIRTVHEGILYQCEQCGQVLTTAEALQDHVKAIHENIREFQCDVCGSNFVNKKVLRDHKSNVHGDKKHVCDQCGKGFPTPNRLRIHDDSVHKGLMTSKCPYCKETFAKHHMKSHIISKHEHDKKIDCNQCDLKFTTSKILEEHINIIHKGIKDFKCVHCNKLFGRKRSLQLHIETVHDGLKRHKCEICETAYGQSGDLKRHKLRAHRTYSD